MVDLYPRDLFEAHLFALITLSPYSPGEKVSCDLSQAEAEGRLNLLFEPKPDSMEEEDQPIFRVSSLVRQHVWAEGHPGAPWPTLHNKGTAYFKCSVERVELLLDRLLERISALRRNVSCQLQSGIESKKLLVLYRTHYKLRETAKGLANAIRRELEATEIGSEEIFFDEHVEKFFNSGPSLQKVLDEIEQAILGGLKNTNLSTCDRAILTRTHVFVSRIEVLLTEYLEKDEIVDRPSDDLLLAVDEILIAMIDDIRDHPNKSAMMDIGSDELLTDLANLQEMVHETNQELFGE